MNKMRASLSTRGRNKEERTSIRLERRRLAKAAAQRRKSEWVVQSAEMAENSAEFAAKDDDNENDYDEDSSRNIHNSQHQQHQQHKSSISIQRLEHCKAFHIWQNCLYLSGAEAALDHDALSQDGITHVFNVAHEFQKTQNNNNSNIKVQNFALYDSPSQVLPLDFAANLMFQALFPKDKLPTDYDDSDSDSDSSSDDDSDASEEENQNIRNKVLIFCDHGQSRSASLVLYFLIKFGNYHSKYYSKQQKHSNDDDDSDDENDNNDNHASTIHWTLQHALTHCIQCKPDVQPNFGFAVQLDRAERQLLGESSFDLDTYKADVLWNIMQNDQTFNQNDDDSQTNNANSQRLRLTRDDVVQVLDHFQGNSDAALEHLLIMAMAMADDDDDDDSSSNNSNMMNKKDDTTAITAGTTVADDAATSDDEEG